MKLKLKFRAFDKLNKRMVYTDWNSFRNWYNQESGGKVVASRGSCFEDNLSEPMINTGLTDKNGIDIYEWDIIKCADYEEDANAWNEWETVVKWDDYTGMWLGIDGEQNEIIGNIYSNPELVNNE